MLEIIEMYEKYGQEVTKKAYGADRKAVSRWKKRLKEAKGRFELRFDLGCRYLF
ncbi:hypothetical protein AGMMS50233_07960 [Endomicrobiia bacterium]|nr:hypothetical protein AGMMS50233_07960 [Endomicrobiia bacterium]